MASLGLPPSTEKHRQEEKRAGPGVRQIPVRFPASLPLFSFCF